MFDEKIERAKVTRPKRTSNKWGYLICGAALLVMAVVMFKIPPIVARAITGTLGVYVYAVCFLVFNAGVAVRLRKRYKLNKRYVIWSVVMLFAVFASVHLAFTKNALATMQFGEYLKSMYTTNNTTPGGIIFAVPTAMLYLLCDGPVGSFIILGILFIIAAAFLTTYIVATIGENKVIKKHLAPFPEDNVPAEVEQRPREIREVLDAKYQELLLKQGRTRHDAQKSELGLDTVPLAAQPKPIYDSAVPLSQMTPEVPSAAAAVTGWSTEAATQLNSGMNQQGLFGEWGQNSTPYQPQPAYNQYPQPTPYQPQAVFNQYAPPAPVQTAYKNPDEEYKVTTARDRGRHRQADYSQQEFQDLPPKKTYKPRRYVKPTPDLIRTESTNLTDFHIDAAAKQQMLDSKLKEFNINAKVTSFTVAPAVTRFEIQLGLGTRANGVYALEPDFQYVLGTTEIRMENVPGKNAIGIEVPNKKVGCVSVKDIIVSREFQNHKSPLAVALGKNLNDEIIVGDITTMPHLLIAGSTGSGKSVCINAILTSLLYRAHPDEVKLLLVDMKRVELNMYNEIPHMLIPRAIADVPQVINALKWMQTEMTRRYSILESNRFNHISQFHAQASYQNGQLERMPYIIMVIDEAADLIHNGKKEVEDAIKRLSALARACGIHIVLATQRPSVDVITAVIKTNFPVRVAFKVNSRGDSTTIINTSGAEKLVGRGDMLFSKEGNVQRVQGAFIEIEEARRVMNFIRDNNTADFDTELEDIILNGIPDNNNAATGFGDADNRRSATADPVFVSVVRWLVRDDNFTRTASISSMQRQFSLGFSRAGKIMDQLTASGYVSASNGSKVRDVIVTRDDIDRIYGNE